LLTSSAVSETAVLLRSQIACNLPFVSISTDNSLMKGKAAGLSKINGFRQYVK